MCSKAEYPDNDNLFEDFKKQDLTPDHKIKQKINIDQIFKACQIIKDLRKIGPVYVHCYASIERSPLICMAWLF